MNVSEIADELNLPFATASRNLIILAKAELLNYRQKGVLFHYSVNFPNPDPFAHPILAVLKSSFKKKSYLISYTDSKLLPPKAKAALGPFIEPRPK